MSQTQPRELEINSLKAMISDHEKVRDMLRKISCNTEVAGPNETLKKAAAHPVMVPTASGSRFGYLNGSVQDTENALIRNASGSLEEKSIESVLEMMEKYINESKDRLSKLENDEVDNRKANTSETETTRKANTSETETTRKANTSETETTSPDLLFPGEKNESGEDFVEIRVEGNDNFHDSLKTIVPQIISGGGSEGKLSNSVSTLVSDSMNQEDLNLLERIKRMEEEEELEQGEGDGDVQVYSSSSEDEDQFSLRNDPVKLQKQKKKKGAKGRISSKLEEWERQNATSHPSSDQESSSTEEDRADILLNLKEYQEDEGSLEVKAEVDEDEDDQMDTLADGIRSVSFSDHLNVKEFSKREAIKNIAVPVNVTPTKSALKKGSSQQDLETASKVNYLSPTAAKIAASNREEKEYPMKFSVVERKDSDSDDDHDTEEEQEGVELDMIGKQVAVEYHRKRQQFLLAGLLGRKPDSIDELDEEEF